MSKDEKIDLFKAHKDQYIARRKPVFVELPPIPYLSIHGKGGPGGEDFERCISALYGMAFTIKMRRKFGQGQDYVVCKLEGIYGEKNPKMDLISLPKEEWDWRLMIRVPEFITQEERDEAEAALLDKGKDPAVKEVRIEVVEEGRCVQMLHLGPYEEEGRTLEVMAGFAAEEGLALAKPHHEIYLSDPRRVPPERLKTILRRRVEG
ncbi:MAG TPA: hypothetical protein ENK02_14375 [Planctomycetes bacterium]|nr:hypothetical protein [Planctomycetota bacterium]